MSQQPSPGRVVLAVGGKAKANGADVAPALITRVWGEREDGGWTVNMTVFPDCAEPRHAPSSVLYADETVAREKLSHDEMTAAYWPPRVS